MGSIFIFIALFFVLVGSFLTAKAQKFNSAFVRTPLHYIGCWLVYSGCFMYGWIFGDSVAMIVFSLLAEPAGESFY